MTTERFARGGFTPTPDNAPKIPMWTRNGLVSFDGPKGPWAEVLSHVQIKERYGSALDKLNDEMG